MNECPPGLNRDPEGTSPGLGFREAGSESQLRDWLLLSTAFTGTRVALVLRGEWGIWYRDSSGLSAAQMAALERVLEGGLLPGARGIPLEGQDLHLLEAFPLADDFHRPIGILCACSTFPQALSANHREGLGLVAKHIQELLVNGRSRMEKRTSRRSLSATSFVPGLVHELGSFIFGISANLDAFEARFAGLEDVSRYGAAIRRSLDRMNGFLEELRDFGDPKVPVWGRCDLGPVLWQAVEDHRPLADKHGTGLQLVLDGPLPPLMADASSLRSAFHRLIGFLLQHEEPGGQVVLQAGTRLQGEQLVIWGQLEGSVLKSRDVDLGRLFEPFYFRTSGLGRLALPVARRIFESHGGNLTACPGPAGGTRIQFQLPALAAEAGRSTG